ncbi:MAG TPA: HAD-IA family hydrolase [Actinomycetota bacterium]
MSDVKVVFFDAGETLLHPHPSFSEIFASVCREAGYDVSPRAVEAVQERLAPHLMDLQHDDDDDDARPYAGSSLDEREARRFWMYLYRRFVAELGLDDDSLPEALFARFSDLATYKLFDDVEPVLHDLQAAGLRLGLISNFERWLEELLVELEIGHLFDVVTISGVAGIEKPDREIYELALRNAGVAPHDAVHVGDSPSMDAEPAAALGMKVVLLDRAGRYSDAPWPRIESLKELQAAISNF